MTRKGVEQKLQKLVPKSLDDVIRANRDRCAVALATEGAGHNGLQWPLPPCHHPWPLFDGGNGQLQLS